MIECDRTDNKILLKPVYHGPALSENITYLLRVHDMLSRESRRGHMVLDTRDDRTIFFNLQVSGSQNRCGSICDGCGKDIDVKFLCCPITAISTISCVKTTGCYLRTTGSTVRSAVCSETLMKKGESYG